MFRCFLPFCNKTYFPPTRCSESILAEETFTRFMETPPCFSRRRAAPLESTRSLNARASRRPSSSPRRLDGISVSWKCLVCPMYNCQLLPMLVCPSTIFQNAVHPVQFFQIVLDFGTKINYAIDLGFFK